MNSKKIRKTTFTTSEDDFIKKYYLKLPVKTMSRLIGRSSCGVTGRMKILNLIVPEEIKAKRKSDSRFKKGHSPINKGLKQSEYMSANAIERTKATRFKKGHLPATFKTGEHITKGGYIKKSIGEGKTKLKHVLIWENHHNKKIPKSHCIAFLDGNRSNCAISNLKLISKTENMLRNSKHNFPREIVPTLTVISQINNKIKSIQNG